MKEANLFLKYIVDSNFTYKFLSNESFEVLDSLIAKGFYDNIKAFKNRSLGPDIIVEFDNKTLLLEHFEFDSSKVIKKSSVFRKNLANINKEFNALNKLKNEEVIIIDKKMDNEASTFNYVKNLMKNLDSHYLKIDNYINNYKNKVNDDTNRVLELGFVIENVSPIADSIIVNNKLQLIYPFNFIEFITFLESNPKIKHIFLLCNHDTESKVVYFYNSKESLIELNRKTILFNKDNELVFKNPHTIMGSIFIPNKD